MKRVLVTGGAGFIGSHVVKGFLARGKEVGVIDNLCSGKKELLPLENPNLIFSETDIRDKNALMFFLKTFNPEAIIHLAALPYIPYCNKHPVETMQVNIMGTRNLLQCCDVVNPSFFFFASSAAVYPVRDDANSEDSELSPIEIYGLTKVSGEDMIELFYRRTKITTVIGRFFNVYGPNDTIPYLIPTIVKQLKSGKRNIELGNLTPKRDFIHASDIVNAIYTLMEKFEEGFGVFNIGTGEEYSVKEVIEFFQEFLGETITIKQKSNRIRKIERMHLLADISKIQKKVGWIPGVNIRQGLKELIA